MVCIGTGYTGRKFGDFLGLSKLERYVGCIEGQKGRMRAMERLVSIGAGYTGRKEGRVLCVKNREKRRILHESGREKSKSRSD